MSEAASPQVQLVVELTTRPGAEREMREALDRLVAATHREDRGVVRFEVGLDPDDDRRVLGYEIWASQDALDEHSAKAHTQEFKARVRDLVVDPAAPMRVARWQPMQPRRAGRRPSRPPTRGGRTARDCGDLAIVTCDHDAAPGRPLTPTTGG